MLLRTQEGFAFAPTRNHEVIPPDEYEKLPEEDKKRFEAAIAALQERLEKILSHMPQWQRERSERIKQLNRETTLSTVEHMMNELRAAYADLPEVLEYLDLVQQDMVENGDDFRKQKESLLAGGMTIVTHETFHRYQVNVLVTNGKEAGAPIVSEDNPTYSNLIGRVEHISQLGALVTDFTLIKPGALHRANGGYLLLDIRKVLLQPFAWEGLKRALQSREIRIESLGQMYSLVSTVSLEPEPIPLDVKVVLFGDRLLYYLLQEYDPEFGELFKVAADFEERIERNADTHQLYARLIATLARKEVIAAVRPRCGGPGDRTQRAPGRRCGKRLSTHMRSIADLLRETDYWAREAGRSVSEAADVQRAIDTQITAPGPLARPAVRSDPARHAGDRDAGRGDGPDQRPVRDRTGQFRLCAADPDHRDHPAGRWRTGQHRARSQALRRDPFQGRADPLLLPRRALCAATSRWRCPPAWCSNNPTAWSRATALRWPNCARCCPTWRMCRSGSRWRSPAR